MSFFAGFDKLFQSFKTSVQSISAEMAKEAGEEEPALTHNATGEVIPDADSDVAAFLDDLLQRITADPPSQDSPPEQQRSNADVADLDATGDFVDAKNFWGEILTPSANDVSINTVASEYFNASEELTPLTFDAEDPSKTPIHESSFPDVQLGDFLPSGDPEFFVGNGGSAEVVELSSRKTPDAMADVLNANIDGCRAMQSETSAVPQEPTPPNLSVSAHRKNSHSKEKKVNGMSGQQTAVVAPMPNKDDGLPRTVTGRGGRKDADDGPEEPGSDEEFVEASADMFSDPAAMEFLQTAGAGSSNAADLQRESLYVNFDPLVAKRKEAEKKAGSRDSPLPEQDLLEMKTPSPAPSRESNNNNQTPCPPTVVKKRAPNAVAMSNDFDVDKFLTASPHQMSEVSLEPLLENFLNSLKTPENENQLEVVAHRLKLQFQAVLLAKEREWSSQYHKQQQSMQKLTDQLKEAKKEADHAKQSTSHMRVMVSDYEKTIASMMKDFNGVRLAGGDEDTERLIRERDQMAEELQSVENAFSDFHKRYEKIRNTNDDYKRNEESLHRKIGSYEEQMKKWEEKYNELYESAERRLEKANQEIERLQKAQEIDTLALRAQLKKRDLQVETLEKSLESKDKEISELTAICDELIQKAGIKQDQE